jgi:hypothetical protein
MADLTGDGRQRRSETDSQKTNLFLDNPHAAGRMASVGGGAGMLLLVHGWAMSDQMRMAYVFAVG